jgi:L-tryptophan--pyruvate aminotransferase
MKRKLKPIKQIDMAWGSPAFLSPYWEINKINVDHVKKKKSYSIGSRAKLRNRIKRLHKKIGNAETKNKHIVVAAGATQIVLGLMHVLREQNPKIKSAWAKPPHFSRFPKLADFAKLDWFNTEVAITITSNPNNPDNSISDETGSTILDLCYNWPQYTDQVKKYDHPVMVFSLSKATGHASTRIGWAILKDKELAKALETYIEISTGGLSIDAQIRAEKVIEHQLSTDYTVFDYGKHVLNERWKIINKLVEENKLYFTVMNSSGMFLWANGLCPPHISKIKGSDLKATDEFFRLNVGCGQVDFDNFLQTICKGIDTSHLYKIKVYY